LTRCTWNLHINRHLVKRGEKRTPGGKFLRKVVSKFTAKKGRRAQGKFLNWLSCGAIQCPRQRRGKCVQILIQRSALRQEWIVLPKEMSKSGRTHKELLTSAAQPDRTEWMLNSSRVRQCFTKEEQDLYPTGRPITSPSIMN
jgi:hypothetical protein